MALGSPRSSRALSPFEENWARSTAGGSGIIVLGALLRSGLTLSAALDALATLLRAHPLLRARIVETSKGPLLLHTTPSHAPADLARHVQEKPWPPHDVPPGQGERGVMVFGEDTAGSLALHRAVVQELNTPFAASADHSGGSKELDVFQVCIYRRSGDEDGDGKRKAVVVFRMHNAVLDGCSARMAARQFFSHLQQKQEGEGDGEAASTLLLLPAMDELLPECKRGKGGLLQKGLETVGFAYKAKRSSVLPFQPGFSGKPPFRSEVVNVSLGNQGTALFLEACTKEGTPFAPALAAAFLKATAAVKELKAKKLDEFSYNFLGDCRGSLEPKLGEGVLGNYSFGTHHTTRAKEETGVWELARQITASSLKDLASCKHFSEMSTLGMLFKQALKYPSMIPNSGFRTLLFTMSSHTPKDGEWLDEEGLGIEGSFGPLISTHFTGPTLWITEALAQGPELVLSLVYPSPLYSRSQILLLVDTALNALTANK